MLTEFDRLVKERRQLKAWWSLGTDLATYDKKYHTLRVDVVQPSMVAFCGQAYPGAKNYHDAPAFFVEAIIKAMKDNANLMAVKAYETEIERLDAAIEKHRASVLQELGNA